MKQRIAVFWQSRTPRERRGLGIMVGVVVVAMLAQLAWTAHGERQRLQRQLPALRGQAASIDAQAVELSRMRNESAPAAPAEGESLLASARAVAGVLGSSHDLRLIGPRQIEIRGTVAFDIWVSWLGDVHENLRLRVVRAEVSSLPGSPGLVRVEAELALPEPR